MTESTSKSSNFISSKIKNVLKKSIANKCNGYLVLIDIKNSTHRKISHPDKWKAQLLGLYQTFKNFVNIVNENSKRVNIEFKFAPVIDKYLGDGMMAFLGTSIDINASSREVKAHQSDYIFDHVNDFIQAVHSEAYFGDLRLKSVICFLTGLELTKSPRDVVGRGIDFAFRLERFADPTHIVINQEFKNHIAPEGLTYNRNGVKYDIVEVKRKVKGWSDDKGEVFYLVTNQQMLPVALDLIPSPHDLDVKTELFKVFQKYYDNNKNGDSINSIVQDELSNLK